MKISQDQNPSKNTINRELWTCNGFDSSTLSLSPQHWDFFNAQLLMALCSTFNGTIFHL